MRAMAVTAACAQASTEQLREIRDTGESVLQMAGRINTVSSQAQQTAEVARKSLVTVDTTASAQITPTVIKFNTALRYEILQAPVPRLTVALPASHALTRIQGEQIRDWEIEPGANAQVLTVEFIKPLQKEYQLTLYSEQTLDAMPTLATLIGVNKRDRNGLQGSIPFDNNLIRASTHVGLSPQLVALDPLNALGVNLGTNIVQTVSPTIATSAR